MVGKCQKPWYSRHNCHKPYSTWLHGISVSFLILFCQDKIVRFMTSIFSVLLIQTSATKWTYGQKDFVKQAVLINLLSVCLVSVKHCVPTPINFQGKSALAKKEHLEQWIKIFKVYLKKKKNRQPLLVYRINLSLAFNVLVEGRIMLNYI